MRAVVLVGLAGCNFAPNSAGPGDGAASDQAVIDAEARDAPIDASMALEGIPACFGTFVTVCIDAPTAPAELALMINTDTSPLCVPYTSPQSADACVIAGTSISLSSGTFVVTGSKPLILVSTASIAISGSATLDVASHRATGGIGPGADPALCPLPGSKPSTTNTKSGGGSGGSFGGPGGNGGNGGGGGIGGVAGGATGATTLRGGCAGTAGAASVANTGGAAGHGGGAVMLIALSTIAISGDGTINASGSAGGGGLSTGGGLVGGGAGGGGASGGMIVLEAQTVDVSGNGRVFANGAGGGEGASSSNNGGPGNESTAPAVEGLGGTGGAGTGGDGAKGAAGSQAAGSGASSGGNPTGGGGGGGGGAGVIKVIGTASGTTNTSSVAPTPT